MDGAGELPGIDGVQVDSTGWTEGRTDLSEKSWHQPGAALSLSYFPLPPDLPHAVGDDEPLFAQFEELLAAEEGMAVVEAVWVDGPEDVSLAQILIKAAVPRGMVYIGSLTAPFAACSWVAKMQALDEHPTGAREAIWLDRHLASGGDLNTLGFVERDGPPGPHEPVRVRRMPSDDPEWDDLVPRHPLSRVRAWLPSCRRSMAFSQEVLGLERFA
jgi:hypothetical protein